MNLQDALFGHMKMRADLILAGVDPVQALNIIAYPLEIQNLEEAISSLKLYQIEELIYTLKLKNYKLPKHKVGFALSGISRGAEGLIFEFVDNVMGIDQECLRTADLPELVKSDLLKEIREFV